jgi:dTDP-4-dehydrorhamnose 3,5-epimerase
VNIIKTELESIYILEPKVFGDHRGWFTESWSKRTMEEAGFHYEFVQDNHSLSAQKHTLRGIHFQLNPYSQAKLVRCTKGAVLDVAIDLRKASPDFMKWIAVELNEENKRQLLIPRGFGHAFLTLTEDVEFLYKTDQYYSAEHDRSIAWNDPDINIQWPIDHPILSEKDIKAPLLKDSDVNF